MTAPPTPLGFAPNENPFVVQHSGVGRRWLSVLDDLAELRSLVASLEATTDDECVPVWRDAGRHHADEGDRLENGPVTDREARLNPDDGHCVFKAYPGWAPASFAWLKQKLAATRLPVA